MAAAPEKTPADARVSSVMENVPASAAVRADRWVACLLGWYVGLFPAILLWVALSSLLRR